MPAAGTEHLNQHRIGDGRVKGPPGVPLEIVRRVLKTRKVKETTILLNLQDRKLFKRVSKENFTLA